LKQYHITLCQWNPPFLMVCICNVLLFPVCTITTVEAAYCITHHLHIYISKKFLCPRGLTAICKRKRLLTSNIWIYWLHSEALIPLLRFVW
jgi:hypothetical protein